MDPKLFYCNQSNLTATPFDFVFNLNRVGTPPSLEVKPGDRPPVQIVDSIQVAMSHAHAKVFAALAINQIFTLEGNMGKPVTLDPEQQKRWDDVVARIKASK